MRFARLTSISFLAALLSTAVGCGGSSEDDLDSGTADSGTPDSGGVDSGTFDAGTFDAGTFDAGTVDAGTHDAGTVDAGTHDAGLADAGTHDAGMPDAGSGINCSSCHAAVPTSGAHTAHLQSSSIASGMGCSECHVVPTDTSHATQPLAITFATGPGDIATLGGLTPTWTAATSTCSGGYCHGGGTTLSGGKVTTPTWTILDGSQSKCDSCHGNPPTANGHIQCSPAFCNVCHLDTYSGGGIDTSAHLHVNGVLEVLALAQRGTINHGASTPPPGHPANVDFDTCAVCHSTAKTCTSCHP